ncbi:S41 family peptidase [Bacteroidota bacterium]
MKNIRLTLLILFCLISLNVFAQENPLWLRYPSISPNGKMILFNYLGDIYKVDVKGGDAIKLTSHTAYDFRPVWSPDGNTIAFSSDRYGNFDIFTIPSEGGQAKRLTFHSGADKANSFTPDGKFIIFSANIQDIKTNYQFPSGGLSELYKVPLEGGRVKRISSTPALDAVYSKDGNILLYHDWKGYEDDYRKHHVSAVTRDVWKYETLTGKHTKLSSFEGENRNPVLASDGNNYYYLSEQFDSNFNVCKASLSNPNDVTQVTAFENHPVRFLSISNNDVLCFGYDGEIYTKTKNGEPQKVNIKINADYQTNPLEYKKLTSDATEMDVSPDGKEIVFIVRGEVYVTSVDYKTTKRITNTPQQERSVSFSPDGKAILYASERNGSWNLYQTKLQQEEEKNFTLSTVLKEETILEIPEETFQPSYSPDGKEVAFLYERTTLKVINLETKEIRTILDGKYNYSYSDGDQWYQWSPDGKWFLATYTPFHLFSNEVALVDAQGKQKIINLTKSGYYDSNPKWMMKGNTMIWFNDRQGLRSHGSWGSQYDVYGLFLNKKTFDQFNLTKEETELLEENGDKKDEKENEDKKDKKKDNEDKIEDIEIDLKNIEDRKVRLTIHSSNLADAIMTPDGKKLYYLSRFEKGFDLWMHDFKEQKTKLVTKLEAKGGTLEIDKKGENIFVFADGKMFKIAAKDHKKKDISYTAEFKLDKYAEKEYLFEHTWRQMKKKFYVTNMHFADWDFYKKEYKKFLPHISNNYDFADLLSEMLGELNASHTGSGYRHNDPNGDKTASLGAIYDFNYTGNGQKIEEVIDKGPLIKADSKIKAGVIIEKIDGKPIVASQDFYQLLNHKAGKNTLLSLFDPQSKEKWTEVVKPISLRDENQLLYKRWVEIMRKDTERLSNGRLGYVHVRGMNSASFRQVYEDLFGKYPDKEGIVIDTRFNGGGWLHDDLAVLFSGKEYVTYVPREQKFGHDPMARWTKKSILLMSESNYSDAHAFPYAYSTLKIGKTVGMPVPGTMTAVWWETLQDNSLYFGMPQVGSVDINGNYLENQQLEPDVKVRQDYEVVTKGRDQQLEKAIEEILKELE